MSTSVSLEERHPINYAFPGMIDVLHGSAKAAVLRSVMHSPVKASSVSFVLLLLLFPYYAISQQVTSRIALNQAGFYPHAPKIAVVTGSTSSAPFYIASTNLRDTLFKGTLEEERQSAYSTTRTRIADFTSFKTKGSFVVFVPGAGLSYVFAISDDAHKQPATSTLKGYYYQRMSMPLEEKFAGRWHRSTGHPDDSVLIHPSAASTARPEGTIISSPGGWYDAGDYNKYIVNSGITMGTLLSAYEDFPGHFKQLATNIPESNDAVPDILNEIIYNLRWMLTMQDTNDGGVYNKCTNAGFDGMVMPGITRLPRYVVQKGTAATLDFAAVTAQASRILKRYQKQLPKLADSCLTASRRAWQWAITNPSMEYNQNAINQKHKPVISTGAYGDRNFADEWFWAATELYLTTKENAYYDVLSKHSTDSVALPSWANVGMLGCYSMLRLRKEFPASRGKIIAAIQARVIAMADGYIEKARASAFGTVMGQSARDFNWGSNSNAGNQGILLVRAYLLTGKKNYIDHALTNLDYIMGRNATGYCFVTGTGSKSPMHPHHRPSVADGITEPVPGLLAGGPNPAMQDKCTYPFTETETAYTDVDCSYASNEIAINWNAPIVYLANAIEALKQQVGYTAR